MHKQIQFRIKGMNRDLSVAAFNPEYAYENMNLRIFSTDSNTTASLTNEKGTKEISNITLEGTVIGQAVIDNCIVLFTTSEDSDIIYKITVDGNSFDSDDIILYKKEKKYGEQTNEGLGFSTEYPIETLAYYEAKGIRKVYWTDNKNQPRVVNIDEKYYKIPFGSTDRIYFSSDSFDFVRNIKLGGTGLEISIEKQNNVSGLFPSGVIQYAFAYYDPYRQESNIFYTSPQYYISWEDRGGSPEETVNVAFKISIKGADTNFKYVRVYSIIRTSINGNPIVKRVTDIPTEEVSVSNPSTFYVDDNSQGESVDPTELLYKGGEEIIAKSINQKDNTLFLGNIKVTRNNIGEIKINDTFIQDYIRDNIKPRITYSVKEIEDASPSGYFYPYKNQLSKSSQTFKTFKRLEYYRFGFQAQYKTGKWSDPIWLGDERNELNIKFVDYKELPTGIPLTKASYVLEDKNLLNALVDNGYQRIRPVVVYPSLQDREVICQGVVCPTVYNVGDRKDNLPYVQSSWFTRPNSNLDLKDEEGNTLRGDIHTASNNWAEFRHNFPIPDNTYVNAEIQCLFNGPSSPIKDKEDNTWSDKYKEWFFVDQSIVTLHSPDLEFNDEVRNLNLSSYKFRIVGIVPITSFNSDVDIQTSTPPLTLYNGTRTAKGFYKVKSSVPNLDINGWKGILSKPYWIDAIYNQKENKTENASKGLFYEIGYAVYPWHREGSLNNTRGTIDNYKSANLKEKKIINSKFSYKSLYFDVTKIWNPANGISGISVWDSNELGVIKIPAQDNKSVPINYYGNADKVLSCPNFLIEDTNLKGYPVVISKIGVVSPEENWNDSFYKSIYNEGYLDTFNADGKYDYNNNSVTTEVDADTSTTGIDPIHIKYKSTPHAVLAFNNLENKQVILPTLNNTNSTSVNFEDTKKLFWNDNITGVYQSSINEAYDNLKYGYLFLGEIYNDSNGLNRFGGTSNDAISNNVWEPCGEPVNLTYNDNTLISEITIEWTEGDTYYQRYDHIKTYPFTNDDTNQVTDLISFMCETRVNIDGRYDRNRGQLNFAINPSNFNLVNKVYSQNNNIFTYRAINTNRIQVNKFPNLITWTKTKTAGELVDNWTNVTLASTLELDGNKGPITSINRFNNNLIAFQENAFSQILYNENMQISSSEGVPIEIANSGKVNGKRYISDTIGCFNKWSICETPRGIYFIDDNSKDIYVFNGQIDNISDRLGFSSWINNTSTRKVWNPVDFKNIVTYYDKINNDVFFITKEECLAFSEKLGTFTSFYSYENSPYFFNVLDKGIWVHNNKLWLHNKGEYNSFFDEDGDKYREFYTTIIANPDMNKDKTFNTLEFRSDTWDKDNNLLDEETFNKLEVWNEYQRGCTILNYNKVGVTNLKKKYRIWRANIPRDNSNMRDRMRNPWLYLKLTKYNDDSNKTILHDMVITYFE